MFSCWCCQLSLNIFAYLATFSWKKTQDDPHLARRFCPLPQIYHLSTPAKTFRIRSPCCVINIRFIKYLQPNRSNGPNISQVSPKHIVISNLFSNTFRIRSPFRYIRIVRYELFTTNLNYLFGMSATSTLSFCNRQWNFICVIMLVLSYTRKNKYENLPWCCFLERK